MNDVAIRTFDLTKVYGESVPVRALDGVNLTVGHGEFVAVAGPSGSGKSTLLHLIGGLDTPSEGRVIVDGQDLAKLKRLDDFRSRSVGFVFQFHSLIPTLTARENVEVPLYETVRNPKARRQRAEKLLDLVNLSHRRTHLPHQLSGGQRQRVAIARALANEPTVILADEPTGNLDSNCGREIIELLSELNSKQVVTVLIITHDPAVVRMTRRVVTLLDGKIVRDQPVENPYVEDLRSFAGSLLGQMLMKDVIPPELGYLELDHISSQLKKIAGKLDC